MNRRQLAFLVLVNAVVSLVIALAVVWAVERRRPAPEELLVQVSQQMQPLIATTPLPGAVDRLPTPVTEANDPNSNINSIVNQPLSQPTAEGTTYIVQAGDILSSIAAKYNVTLDAIMEANNLSNPDRIFSGQQLVIPGGIPSDSIESSGEAGSGQSQSSQQVQEGVQIAAIDNVGVLESESVLIVNESNTPFNLQGWTLASEGSPVYQFGNLPIFPGGSVRVHSQPGTNSSIDLYWGQTASIWSPKTIVRLVNAEGNLVHSYLVP
ncbi:LysM peptidoglycan-binding domain-containing protein [Chloroflexi bacterium TSY]|nr:LysM peptidoglycan-binding domain-containing protein [Chloroflexi bacterium TSY]